VRSSAVRWNIRGKKVYNTNAATPEHKQRRNAADAGGDHSREGLEQQSQERIPDFSVNTPAAGYRARESS